MKREFLRDLGLEEEIITKILDEVGREKGSVIDGKDDEITKLKSSLQTAEGKLETAEKTIKELKESNADNKDLQGKIEEYKAQIDQISAKANLDRIDMGIELALTKAGAINPKTVKPLIDTDDIKVTKDGSIVGLDEQIKSITENEEYGFLFKSTENEPQAEQAVDHGGYTPLAGSAPETSLGMQIGERAKERYEARVTKPNDFWESIENGRII